MQQETLTMITDTIERIKTRRLAYRTRRNSELNERIKGLRTEIVKLSFQGGINSTMKADLQEELAGLKQQLNQLKS
jgi:uncharacterized small protein (DUF1192 family)